LGIVAAFACFISKLSTQGLLIGALVYLLSFPVMIWAFNIRIQGKGHSFYTLGFGSYLFVWLTLWSLFNTYLPNS
jgi:ABC-type transport system involved in cytochrome c biogenesis permease component